jgi:hypothetical protein
MEPITFNFVVTDDDIIKITDAVQENLNYHAVYSELSQFIDADDIIENITPASCREIVSLGLDDDVFAEGIYDNKKIIEEIASEAVDESLDEKVEEYVDGCLDGLLTNILASYDPNRNCTLGRSFTDAVKEALIHLTNDDEDTSIAITRMIAKSDPVVEEKVFSDAEPETIGEPIVGLFNKDLVGVMDVVKHLVTLLAPEKAENPSLLIDLQMGMWQRFCNARSSYMDSLAAREEG